MPSAPASRDLANAIRALSMDAVQKANSGHPGAPMGMADIAEVLWRGFMQHNPADPTWADRDRFVLSNGHGSMLLYSLLHLTGYGVSLDDIKNSASWAVPPPDTRNTVTRRASKPPPAHWVRGWPMPWAWRWPRKCWRGSSTAKGTPW